MKYYRAGYTLVEILITMSIIGVVAALTMTGLNNFFGNKVICSKLSRAYQLTSNALVDVINHARQTGEAQVYALSAIQLGDINPNAEHKNTYLINQDIDLFEQIGHIAGFRKDENYNIDAIINYDGSELSEDFLDRTAAYRIGRQGVIVIYQIPTANNIPGNNDDRIITRIYIDANAEESPNRLGCDIFLFGMTNQGALVPAGSQIYRNFDNTVALYTDACAGDNPTNGLSCAARVMADNWNINYR